MEEFAVVVALVVVITAAAVEETTENWTAAVEAVPGEEASKVV